MTTPKRIVFWFSDTGGGHRSAAEAIIEALKAKYADQVEPVMVDAIKQYAPPPFNRSAEWYAKVSNRRQWQWGLSYYLSNGPRRFQLARAVLWPYIQNGMRRAVRENPADLYVSVHPILSRLTMVYPRTRPPFVTVVTDAVTAHIAWFAPEVDACVVPTELARQQSLRYGMPANKLRVIGMPVSARFSQPTGDRLALKAKLGWGAAQAKPVVLIVGGGEGVGPLYEVTQAISRARLDCEVAVVCGRNQKLLSRLQASQWNLPVHAYGFVREMPDFMRAAEVLVTKAGPGTISEACIAGLPMILYSRLPGQEEGNVSYVVDEGAGVWAPKPGLVVNALRHWLGSDSRELRRAAVNARRLARPNAAQDIADFLASYLDLPSNSTPQSQR
ncbi:MAG: MGDG synthase family glycosyltransferase [Anaerolineales bacterium]